MSGISERRSDLSTFEYDEMRVSSFVRCLDQLWPSIGVSTVEVLRRIGCEVTFNAQQTCCGQPVNTKRSGTELIEMPNADSCCGFGGTFSVKYPEISVAILDQKIESIEPADVAAVVSADASCLMQIGGRLAVEAAPPRDAFSRVAGCNGIKETRGRAQFSG